MKYLPFFFVETVLLHIHCIVLRPTPIHKILDAQADVAASDDSSYISVPPKPTFEVLYSSRLVATDVLVVSSVVVAGMTQLWDFVPLIRHDAHSFLLSRTLLPPPTTPARSGISGIISMGI